MAQLTDSQINKLVDVGGSRWTKGDHDRIYFNTDILEEWLDAEFLFYKTGKLSGAKIHGEWISNNKGRGVWGEIGAAKVYVDVQTGETHIEARSLDLIDWDVVRYEIEGRIKEIDWVTAKNAWKFLRRVECTIAGVVRPDSTVNVSNEPIERPTLQYKKALLKMVTEADRVARVLEDDFLEEAPKIEDLGMVWERLKIVIAVRVHEGDTGETQPEFWKAINQMTKHDWARFPSGARQIRARRFVLSHA